MLSLWELIAKKLMLFMTQVLLSMCVLSTLARAAKVQSMTILMRRKLEVTSLFQAQKTHMLTGMVLRFMEVKSEILYVFLTKQNLV